MNNSHSGYKISILVVEDEPVKMGIVIECLKNQLFDLPTEIDSASTYEEALSKLELSCYDILILDINIPGACQEPSHKFSFALLRNLFQGNLNSPTHVIGLTQYEEIVTDCLEEFDQHLFFLETFSYDNNYWAQRVGSKIRYIFESRRNLSKYNLSKPETDYVIMVARYKSEFLPIVEQIPWVVGPSNGHYLFPNFDIVSGAVDVGGEHRTLVVVCLNQMGIAAASSIATQLCISFRPRLITILGMCCGIQRTGSPIFLNDVIVADSVACWDEGKYTISADGLQDSFVNRATTIPLSNRLDAKLSLFMEKLSENVSDKLSESSEHKFLFRKRKYKGEIDKKPNIKKGRVVSGLNVVDDSNLVEVISKRFPEAAGLDMETYGLFRAASLMPLHRPFFLSIKGVADFGKNKVAGHYDAIQISASKHSLCLFLDVIKFLDEEEFDYEH